jgi:hypothetical protein
MSTPKPKLKAGRPTKEKETREKTLADLKAEVAPPIARLNANVPKPLLKRLKQRALDEDTTLTDVVIKAVNEYLSKGA